MAAVLEKLHSMIFLPHARNVEVSRLPRRPTTGRA
jgi:hypothetical protein